MRFISCILRLALLLPFVLLPHLVFGGTGSDPHIVSVQMNMMILPGTAGYLRQAVEAAEASEALAVVVILDTPGGLLQSAQEMVQTIYASKIPVIVYVGPSGGRAGSAGVFVTMAGHVAAMAPGTGIGAAHPVSGTGEDLTSDLRKKAENLAASMAKSIAETRGRNADWAERSVRESSTLTERQAVEQKVVDFEAFDVADLLRKVKGLKTKIGDREVELEDLSAFPIRPFNISLNDQALNLLGNPQVIALLWLIATTCLSLELYNPGAVVPGVVGGIALILALTAAQIIPVSYGAVALLVLGSGMIGLELLVPSGILGLGGTVAIVLGTLSLIDTGAAPGMEVNRMFIGILGSAAGLLLLGIVSAVARTAKRRPMNGMESMIGKRGIARETFPNQGKISVEGEIWSAVVSKGVVEKGNTVVIVGVREGLLLEIEELADGAL